MPQRRKVVLYRQIKIEKMPCEQFLRQIEIFRTFLRAKQVRGKRGRFQFVVEIAHKAVVVIIFSISKALRNYGQF